MQDGAFLGVCKGEALDASGVEDGVEPGVVRAEHDTVAADLAKSYDGVSVAYGRRLVRAVDDEAAVKEDVCVGLGELSAGGEVPQGEMGHDDGQPGELGEEIGITLRVAVLAGVRGVIDGTGVKDDG